MTENQIDELTIDEDFKILVQPYAGFEKRRLAYDVTNSTESHGIEVWDGRILYDFITYSLCRGSNLRYHKITKYFNCKQEAIAYICKQQFTERRDLTEMFRKYLLGMLFLSTREAIQENRKTGHSNILPVNVTVKTNGKNELARELGTAFNMAGGTINKYSCFAEALNTLREKSPETVSDILTEKLKVSIENVTRLSKLTSEQIDNLLNIVKRNNIDRITDMDFIAVLGWSSAISSSPKPREHSIQRSRTQLQTGDKYHGRSVNKASTVQPKIREMPKYDPDAKINSLSLTVPSWVDSIERVNRETDYSQITATARIKLIKQLAVLEKTIGEIQSMLEKDGDYNE